MDISSLWPWLALIGVVLALALLVEHSRNRRAVIFSPAVAHARRKPAAQDTPLKQHSLLTRSQVIAVYNIKGGVGKTSSAVNLAYKLAARGHKTLLWDMDPQGATSFYLNCAEGIEGGLASAVAEMNLNKTQRQIINSLHQSGYDNLYLLPADTSFRYLDIQVASAQLENQFIKQFLAPFREAFDYIVVDCPPGLTVAVESLLNVSDRIVTPVIPSPLSVRMFEQLKAFVHEEIPSHPKLTAFFSMVDTRKKMHKNIMLQLLSENRQIMLPIVVPYSADVERMGREKAPLTTFAEGVAADRAFDYLVEHVSVANYL